MLHDIEQVASLDVEDDFFKPDAAVRNSDGLAVSPRLGTCIREPHSR
jgi:hypothetical protein